MQKTPDYVVAFGKEPNKGCHDTKTNDQQPQEESAMKNETTGAKKMKLESDIPVNKTLDENSVMQYKAPRAEQEEFESEQANKVSGSRKRKAITIRH